MCHLPAAITPAHNKINPLEFARVPGRRKSCKRRMMSAPPLRRCGPHNILKYEPRAHASPNFIPFLEPRFNLHWINSARDYLEAARVGTRRRGVEVSNYKHWTIRSCRFVCTAV